MPCDSHPRRFLSPLHLFLIPRCSPCQVLNLFLALLLSSFGASNLSSGPDEGEPNKLAQAIDRIDRFIAWVKRSIRAGIMAVINKVRGRKADAVADGSRSLPLDNTDDNETLADGYLANNANDKYYHQNNTTQSQQQQQQQSNNNNNTTSSDPVEVTIADGGTHQTCRQNGTLMPVPNGKFFPTSFSLSPLL